MDTGCSGLRASELVFPASGLQVRTIIWNEIPGTVFALLIIVEAHVIMKLPDPILARPGHRSCPHTCAGARGGAISLLIHAVLGILFGVTTFTIPQTPLPPGGPREFAVEVRSTPAEAVVGVTPAPAAPDSLQEPEIADAPPLASVEFTRSLPALSVPVAERVVVLPLSINSGVPALRSIIRGGASGSGAASGSASTPAPDEQTASVPAVSWSAPEYASNPPPPYPPLARRMGWQGVVVLRVRIGAGGSCLGAEISRSSGHGVFDDAARKAVQSWQFKPATRDGVPVEGEVDVPIRFTLVD